MIPLQTHHWSLIRPAVSECCLEVFSFYEMDLRPAPDDKAERKTALEQEGVATFLGFTGAQMTGSLVLISNMPLLRRAYPVPLGGEPFTMDDAQDWLGELANQIVGKIKARLSVVGVSFMLSLPRCVAGTGLRLAKDKNSLMLTSGALHMLVGLDAVIDPAVNLARLAPSPRTSFAI